MCLPQVIIESCEEEAVGQVATLKWHCDTQSWGPQTSVSPTLQLGPTTPTLKPHRRHGDAAKMG